MKLLPNLIWAIMFLLTGCITLHGLGNNDYDEDKIFIKKYGKIEDYPDIVEFKNESEVKASCKELGLYSFETSWQYKRVKNVFFHYTQKMKGNAFVRTNTEKAGLINEFNKYTIRYFKCENY